MEFAFSQFSLLIADVCASDHDRDIRIEVFQSSKTGRHKNLGSSIFTINTLKSEMAQTRLPLSDQASSFLSFSKLEIHKRHTFLEYIFGGCQINLSIAIDFTLSNGRPTEADSLHCANLHQNQYYQALSSVVDVLQFYDWNK